MNAPGDTGIRGTDLQVEDSQLLPVSTSLVVQLQEMPEVEVTRNQGNSTIVSRYWQESLHTYKKGVYLSPGLLHHE